MSISRACYVSCDVCRDPAPISCTDAEEARQIARGEGYRRVRIDGKLRDVCPRCRRDAVKSPPPDVPHK